MKVEYDLMKAPVTYEQEKQLGEDPIRLDFLIIKKQRDAVLTDPIGKFFRIENLFEYKSPEDGLSIDDFYKAKGYGFIYKGFNRKVNELPISDMTLTLVRHSYPRELIKELNAEGYNVEEVYQGIYHINGGNGFPVQLVVTSRLPEGDYEGLKLLAKGATKENVIEYVEKALASADENIKENAGTVIEICLSVNEKLKEAGTMHEVIRDMFKKDFYNERQEGIKETNERVASDMLRENYPLKAIAKISKLSEDVIRNIASNLGIAVV